MSKLLDFLSTKSVSVEPVDEMWGVFEYRNRLEYAMAAWKKYGFRVMCHNLIWLWRHWDEN